MDTSLQYKISLAASTGICCLFILLVVLSSLNMQQANAPAIIITIAISGSCLVILLFNLLCYQLLKANKDNRQVSGQVIKYRKSILVLTIIALAVIAFMLIAATVAFVSDVTEFSKSQRPFFIFFLLLILAIVACGIQNIVYYFKAFFL